jgi:hypothetical protein
VVSIVLMLAAWGIASNRCAFAALALNPQAAAVEVHKCCPTNGDEGGKQTPDNRLGECCQHLQVLLLADDALVKLPAASVLFELAWLYLAAFKVEENAPVEFDTGPPQSRSFAEVVLQRSLLSHAPPFEV